MEDVKADILAFMASLKAEVGHVLPKKPFVIQRVRGYSPPQQDLVEPALESLVQEGCFELRGDDYVLTQVGYDKMYPMSVADEIQFVRSDILDFLRSCQARVGHALAEKPYQMQRMRNYNPQQIKAVDQALESLIGENILEHRSNGYFVTESGYKAIYGS